MCVFDAPTINNKLVLSKKLKGQFKIFKDESICFNTKSKAFTLK